MLGIAYALMILLGAAVFAFRVPGTTVAGNELSFERSVLTAVNAATLTGFQQARQIDGFAAWTGLGRERLQTLFESKMEQLVEKLVETERWTAVQEQCERWLALGFVSEPAYRALMLSYNARGDMAKVSSIYQRCAEDLQDARSVGNPKHP